MSSGLYSGVSGLALGIGLYRNVSGLWGGASGLINGFGGADPYAGASLYLNFLAGPPLDSRITFSRGTNATLVDATGRITYAPNNLLVWSETLSETSWVKSNVTVSGNAVTATASTGNHRLQRTAAAPYSFIFWVEATAGTQRYIQLYNGATTGMYANFDLVAGTVGTVGAQASASIVNLGEGRYRCALIINGAVNPNNAHLIGMITAANAAWGESWTAAGTETFTLHLAQLEAVTYQTTPSTYVATTSAAYYGPRFDYNPVTLAPRGLLIEEARTNLLLRSEEFDNAAWTKLRYTVSANTLAAPDGTSTADSLLETTDTNSRLVRQTITLPATVVYTISAYIKGGLGRDFVVIGNSDNNNRTTCFNIRNGTVDTQGSDTTSTITDVGNGWYLCRVTVNVAASSLNAAIGGRSTGGGNYFDSYTGDATKGFYVWGAQLEAGSFATSYIPTVASTATRNAENAQMTGTNFSSWYNTAEGTIVTVSSTFNDFDDGVNATISTAVSAAFGTALTNQFSVLVRNNLTARVLRAASYFRDDTTSLILFEGVDNSYPANTVMRVAVAMRPSDYAASFNGGSVQSSALPASVVGDQLNLGCNYVTTGGPFLNGHIRQIAYFNTRLPDAQLQTLTAPSLATTLSLDFTTGSYSVGF